MLDIIQPVITKDNVTCQIVSTVYFRIVDPILMLYKLGEG
jgi:regulator of protease activity HflC (stomatin/prohibitin superfamily)